MITAEEYLARLNGTAKSTQKNSAGVSTADDYLKRYYERNKDKLDDKDRMKAIQLGVVFDIPEDDNTLTRPKTLGEAIFNGTEAAEQEIALREANINAWSAYLQQQEQNLTNAEERLAMSGSSEEYSRYNAAVESYNEALKQAKGEENSLEKLRELYMESYKKEHPEYETNLKRAELLETVGEWDEEDNYILNADFATVIKKAEKAGDEIEGQLWIDLLDRYLRPTTAEEEQQAEAVVDAQIARLQSAGTEEVWQEFEGQMVQVTAFKRRDEIAKLERLKKSMKTSAATERYNNAYEAVMAELPEELRKDIMGIPAALAELDTYTKTGGGSQLTGDALAKEQSVRLRLRDMGYSKDEINGMLEYASQSYNALQAAQEGTEAQETAAGNSTLANWAKNVVLGLGQSGELIGLTAQTALKGWEKNDPFTGEKTPVDYNAARIYNLNSAILSGQEKKVMDKYLARYDDEEQARKKANFAMNTYQLAVSMGESALNMAMAGAGVPGTTLLLGASSGVSTVMDYKEQGYSDGEAMAMGMVSAAAEYFTEKYSVESFFKMKDLAGKTGKAALMTASGNILRQALSEGSEEFMSDVANTVGDALVMTVSGRESKLRQEYEELRLQYINDGMTTEEAEAKAGKVTLWNNLKGALESAAGGAISGALFGIGGNVISSAKGAIQERSTGKAIQKSGNMGSFRKLVEDFGGELAEDASYRETGKALRSVETKATDEAIEKRLDELGEAKNPVVRARLIEAIKAEATGQRLNTQEQRAMEGSRFGEQVASEYGEVINGGEVNENNRWAYRSEILNEMTARAAVTAQEETAEAEETEEAEEPREPRQKNYSQRAGEILNDEEQRKAFEFFYGPLEGSNTQKRQRIAETLRAAERVRAAQSVHTEDIKKAASDSVNAGNPTHALTSETAGQTTAFADNVPQSGETVKSDLERVNELLLDGRPTARKEILRTPELRTAYEENYGRFPESNNKAMKAMEDTKAMLNRQQGMESYVRGLMMDMDEEAAREILEDDEYRAVWERITGRRARRVNDVLAVAVDAGSGELIFWEESDLLHDGRLNDLRDGLMEQNHVDIAADDGNIRAAVGQSKGKWIAYASLDQGQAVTAEGTTRQAAVDELMKEIEDYGRQNESGARAGGQRTLGVDTDGEAGRVVSVSGEAQSRMGSGRRPGIQGKARRDAVQNLNKERSSPADYGIIGGSRQKTAVFFRYGQSREVNELIDNDRELRAIQDRAEARGEELTFFAGLIEIKQKNGKYLPVDGVQQGKRIFIQVDSDTHTASGLYDHEDAHMVIWENGGSEGELFSRLSETIKEQVGSEERFREIFKAYAKDFAGLYDEKEIIEEMICDAAGRMNSFTDTAELSDAVRKAVEENRRSGTREAEGIKQMFSETVNLEEDYSYPVEEDALYTQDRLYSYDFLTHQKDMEPVILPTFAEVRGMDENAISREGLSDAEKYGSVKDTPENGKIVRIKNAYTNRIITISKGSIKHGIRKSESYGAKILAKQLGERMGAVAKNGIPINGLVNRNTQVDGTYALAGYARDIKDNEYIAIITVEHYSGNIVDSEIIDVGHAIRGRIKNERGPVSQDVKSPKKTIHRDPHSPITIAELLEIVNSTHRGILSKDVLDYFGEERSTEGEYVKEVKFSQLGVDTDNPIYRSGIDEADTDPIDESVHIDRLPKAEAQTVAEEQNYPVLMREDGGMERAVPGWTWVRASDRGNYGYVSGAKNGMLEVTFVNKANDISYTPKELFAPGQLTAVDAEYQGEQAPMGEAPPETNRYIPTEEEEAEFEAIMQEEEDRRSGKTTTAQQIVAGGELNENEESPQKIIREALEDEPSLKDVELAGDAAQYDFILRATPGKGGSYSKTLDQNMDELFERPEDRKTAERLIVKPVHDATGAYAKEVERRLSGLARKMQSLGITEDMAENRAIVWYGEGIKQGEGSGLPPEETAEYTLENLKAEFPNTWKQVKEAAEYMRGMYDEMLAEQNASRSKVYPNIVEKAQAKIEQHRLIEERYKRASTEQGMILSELRKQIRAKEATLERTSSPAARAALESQIAEMKLEAEKIIRKCERYDSQTARARTIAVKLQADIDSGRITRGKYVPARKDYFHHGREMATGIEGLLNTLTTSADIDTALAGQSEFTKPKAKWQGHLQQRSDAIYNANAIRDMQSYIKAAAYVTNIDPAIARLRQQASYMAQITEKSRNANKMLTWMTDYINQLAGKTNPMDRFLMSKVMGRKALKVMKWVNGRVKANAVGANVRSAVAQFFNLQNAAMLLKNPQDWKAGSESLVQWMTGDESARAIMASSDFLTSRYGMGAAENMFETSKLRKASDYMMQFGDEAVARLAWWTAYERALNINEENPIYYADDIVRRAVAGRGIGEVPLIQDSELTKFLAPFQVEVNNTFQLVKRKVKERDFGALAIFALVSYLMNEPLRELFGFDVSWDPINAAIEAVQSTDEDDSAWQKTTKIAGRLVGETIGNMAYGSQLAQTLVSDDTKRKELFGESDPTRFGTGQIGINMITDPIIDLITGDEASEDLLEAVLNIAMPYGGKQTTRLIDTLQTYGVLPEVNISTEDGVSAYRQKGGGAAYTAGGRLKYAPESTWENWTRSLLFGNLTTKEGMAYLEDGSPMSEEMTADFRMLTENGVSTTRAAEIVRAVTDIEKTKGLPSGQKQLNAIAYLAQSGLDGKNQQALYYNRMASDSQKEKIDAMSGALMDWDDISDALTTYYALSQDESLTASQRATELAGWAMSNLTMLQAQTVRENLTYSSGFRATADTFDAFVDAGLEPTKASEVVMMFANIRPEDGRNQPTEVQKMYSLSTAKYLSDSDRYAVTGAMLGTEMETESGNMSQYAKMLIAQKAGMSYDDFVSFKAAEKTADKARVLASANVSDNAKLEIADTFTTDAQSWYLHNIGQYGVTVDVWADFLQLLPMYDADGNGSYKQAEVANALRAMKLEDETKAALWQMQTGGSKNPFDAKIGKTIAAAYKAKKG